MASCKQKAKLQFVSIHPLKWQADLREEGAELTFMTGGLDLPRLSGESEMAQVQRIAPLCPPRAYLGVVAAGVREESAENAKAENVTQSRKAARTQSETRLSCPMISDIHNTLN